MLTEQRTELPRFTRFVHSVCLCAVEGLSLGFALATSLYSSRLVQFVKTNRIDPKLRKEILAVVLLPAFLLPAIILTLALASTQLPKGRLHQVERRIRLLAPCCGLGFLPLLLRPTLWVDQSLAFLLVTGVFATIVTLTVRISALAWADGKPAARHWTDFDSLRSVTVARISPRLLSIVTIIALLGLAFLSVVRPMRETALAGTVINSEWTTIHKISSASGFATWLGAKGWRISGHVGYLAAIYAIAVKLLGKPEGLLLLRAFGVSCAAIPLYLWSKRSLGAVTAGLISFAYLSMPIAGMLQLRDTFPITIALGVFFLAANRLESGRIGTGLALVFLGIALNEQIALWFALLGAYLTRWEHRRSLGQWLAVTSLLYFLVVALYVMPHLGIKTYGPDDVNRASISVQNLGPSLTSLLANPAYTLSRWFEMQGLEFWLALTVPLALLPLRGRYWLLWLGPVLVFACSATTAESNSQWRDPVFGHTLALGFLALIGTLQTLRESSIEYGPIRMRAALIGWAAALAPVVATFGALYIRLGPQ